MNDISAPAPSRAAGLLRWIAAHPALVVVAFGLLLYLPYAGSYGLWDPWETHYGEVARQMTARRDYISLWWPGSPRETATFQTKPALSFWLMSLSMKLFGIGGAGGPADEMVAGPRAAWALRVPFCLLGALGLYAVYLVTARLACRRAGLLAALVTATFPLYALVARQAMTDMAFIGPVCLAVALAALALEDEGASGRSLRVGTLALLLLVTVPQLVIDSIDLHVHVPWHGRLVTLYGVVAMIPYWVGLLAAAWLVTRARHRAPLYLTIAGILGGLAVLGKGLAGLAFPVLVVLLHALVSGRWRRLRQCQIPLGALLGTLAAAVVAIPWHHAMYIRHGAPWWNELYGDNHWRRLMIGRNGDRGTFEYFLREIGYDIWPWLALALPALATAVLRPSSDDRRRLLQSLGVVWFVTGYAVVSLSMTKFHHYILLALPGLGILIALFLDELMSAPNRHRRAILIALTGLPLLAVVSADLLAAPNAAQRFLWLFSYDYVYSPNGRPWPAALDFRWPLAVLALLAGIGTAALAIRRSHRAGAALLGGAALLSTIYLLDVYMPAVAPYWSQQGVIAHYFRARRSPDEHLLAYYLFWRGETFYTKNAIYDGPDEDRTVFDHGTKTDERLRDWLDRHRGHRQFFMYEPSREAHLRALLPGDAQPSFQVIDRSNNKFVLATAQL